MKIKLTVLIVSASVLLVTCKHEIQYPKGLGGNNPPPNPPAPTNSCSPDSVYFGSSILPVISSACAMSGCHDPVKHEAGLVLNNYTGIMRIVEPGNASGSKLYKVITAPGSGDVMPPPPHSRLAASVITAIQKWITQGAKNNQCAASCDTSLFSYSGAVLPLINTFCKGCHNPASLGGGIDLSTYAGIKAVAVNGKLMGSIKHLPGYKAMPQGGNQLQDCQIRQMEKWIQAGMLNN